MKTKHAAEIRKGVLAAKRAGLPGGFVLLNSKYYSRLAVYAYNIARQRQTHRFVTRVIEESGRWL